MTRPTPWFREPAAHANCLNRVVTTNSFDARAATWDDDPATVERAEAVARTIRATVPVDRSIRMLEYGAGTGLTTHLAKGHATVH